MQWKLVSAFSTGAVLASGIVYFAVKPRDVMPQAPQPVASEMAAAAQPQPAPVVPAKVEPIAAPVAEKTPDHARTPAREKPSPMPPLVHHQDPVEIARNEPPAPVQQREAAPVEPPPTPQTAEPVPVPEPTAPPPSAAPAPVPNPVETATPPPPAPEPRPEQHAAPTVTLRAGTLLAVRIGETISTAHNQAGDTFLATLTRPLVIDGWIIADRGERVEGRIVEATPAGRGGGGSQLAIALVRLATDDHQNLAIRTEPYTKHGNGSAGADAAKVGAGAAIGAVIGAIAGGGKGAAIGAGVGGAAGAGDVLLTRGRPVEIPVETLLTFRVEDPVTITERLDY